MTSCLLLCMVTLLKAISTKGDNFCDFLFASLHGETLLKGALTVGYF